MITNLILCCSLAKRGHGLVKCGMQLVFYSCSPTDSLARGECARAPVSVCVCGQREEKVRELELLGGISMMLCNFDY